MALTRTLGNLPPNICNPAYLADTAKKLAEEFKLDCEILERADMEALGMGVPRSPLPRGSHQSCQTDRPPLQR